MKKLLKISLVIVGVAFFIWICKFDSSLLLMLLAATGPTLVAYVSLNRLFYDKNRNIYERRLNEVYAPLYGLLVRQELFRDLYLPDITTKEAPILSSKRIKRAVSFSTSDFILKQDVSEEVGFLDRKEFIRVLESATPGLARPKLLKLINQYKLLIYLEEHWNKEDDRWQLVPSRKVNVERELFNEIVSGYEETIEKLQLKDKVENIIK